MLSSSFSFGQVRFDPRGGELRRDDGVVKLTPRAAAVLSALAERAEQLVTKQELIDRVWGGRVVGDDLCTGWRNFSQPEGQGDDAMDRLMDRHFKRFPCPARAKAQDRAPVLARLAEKSGARGVVFFMQKFCTPHVADLPVVLEALQERGVRGLVVEMGETGFSEGQMRTRVEAFLEMLRD